MSTPFYVSPAQIMADKADYARKGIARGRSVVVIEYTEGILFVAENISRTLHKISEVYDRIAFAAVGRYNEFENLRVAGVRMADLRGYSYDRRDVTGRGLANVYAQNLGAIFSAGSEKPLEVEIVVAEVGEDPEGNQIYRLTYDGTVSDERDFVVMGGQADAISAVLKERFRSGMGLGEALRTAVEVLARDGNGEKRSLTPAQLEVAVLDRSRSQQRKFKRLAGVQLSRLLDAGAENGGAENAGAENGGAEDSDAGEAGEAKPGSAASDDATSSTDAPSADSAPTSDTSDTSE